MELITVNEVRKAAQKIQGVVKKTALDYSRSFSNFSGKQVYLKLENLQRTGSFKIRGAYNKIINLDSSEKEGGVIAASAGNHAQGVALAAMQAGIESTVVMPKGVSIAKAKATKNYGAQVILKGETYDDAYNVAEDKARKTEATIIPAFDDKDIIAGQGTIALEILADFPEVEVILVPVGGGGLLAGIATVIKELKPKVEVIGVEAERAAAMKSSLFAGKLISLTEIDTIADGIAIKKPGRLTYSIISELVDRIITVTEEEIAYAISLLLERSKLVVEGAAATVLAALLQGQLPFKGKKVVAVLSGGNIDLNMMAAVINRGLIKAGRRIRLATYLPDRPGVLEKLLRVISKVEANIISVSHNRSNPDLSLQQAEVRLVLETRDQKHTETVIKALEKADYDLKRLR
ncbi:threonine ammonia-lyase [Fuchsiella alkaliacetigena]|uniref:threonine ammonia-lyase n=1 Tax=Fuchsiella alkaliacetigena TaxID=957042 RepID=UPI00200B90E7|nr:threonine ammonia-lyase [Fuchsiella alkaliacetigena]MCK8825103.1 threonine ammonia-lyase [Fuchsiella alkaliacetigena]